MLYVCSHLIIAGSLFRCGSQSFKQAKCECTRASKLTLTKSVSVCIHLQSQCVNYTFLGALIVILVCMQVFFIYKVWSFQNELSWEGYFLARLCFSNSKPGLNIWIMKLCNPLLTYFYIVHFKFLGPQRKNSVELWSLASLQIMLNL